MKERVAFFGASREETVAVSFLRGDVKTTPELRCGNIVCVDVSLREGRKKVKIKVEPSICALERTFLARFFEGFLFENALMR